MPVKSSMFGYDDDSDGDDNAKNIIHYNDLEELDWLGYLKFKNI